MFFSFLIGCFIIHIFWESVLFDTMHLLLFPNFVDPNKKSTSGPCWSYIVQLAFFLFSLFFFVKKLKLHSFLFHPHTHHHRPIARDIAIGHPFLPSFFPFLSSLSPYPFFLFSKSSCYWPAANDVMPSVQLMDRPCWRCPRLPPPRPSPPSSFFFLLNNFKKNN